MRYDLIPDRFPVLQRNGLTLRELAEEDLEAWFARRTDPEAAAFAGDPIASSMSDIREGFDHHRHAFQAKEGLRWAIVPDDLGVSVGTIGFGEFDSGARGASVGAAIGRSHWGQGIATRAGGIVLDYAFSKLRLTFVCAVVLPENTRVIRVVEKLGFVQGPARDGINLSVSDRTDTLYYELRPEA